MNIRPTDLVVLQNGRIYLACKWSDGAIYLCHPALPQIGLVLYNDEGKPIRSGVLYPQEDEAIVKVVKRGDRMYEDFFIRYAYLEKENI